MSVSTFGKVASTATTASSAATSGANGATGAAGALIRYYFDYKSPFSFLSFDGTRQLERGMLLFVSVTGHTNEYVCRAFVLDFKVTVEYHPHPFPMKEAFGLPGERNSYHQLKLKYAYLDARYVPLYYMTQTDCWHCLVARRMSAD
jgi:hypothetical protein